MPTTEFTANSQPLLVQLLLEKEILSPEQVQDLGEVRAKDHGPLESLLVKKGLVLEQHIAEVYADYLMVPLFDIAPEEMDPQLAGVLPEKLCRDHHFVPVEIRDDTLDVAFSTFEDMLMVDELQLLTGMNIRPMMAPLSVVEKTQNTLYLATRTKFISRLNNYASEDEDEEATVEEASQEPEDDDILSLDAAPPAGRDGRVIRMVNQILEEAIRMGASDIHLEPFEDSCEIRLRVDGELRPLRRRRRRSSCPSFRVSRFWRKWTSPRSAFRRTAPLP